MPNYTFDFRYTPNGTSSGHAWERYDIVADNEWEARRIAEERFDRTHEFSPYDLCRTSRGVYGR